jgi:outer membrane lipoprotein carrier protein
MIKRHLVYSLILLSGISFSLHSEQLSVNNILVAQRAKSENSAMLPTNSPILKIASEQGSKEDKASLRSLLGQFSTLKGTFTQTIVDMQGEELQSASGELFLQKPQKLRWSVQAPDESLLIADGISVYNFDPFLEQVTIVNQAALTQSNPLMLLISDEPQQWDQVSVVKQENTYTIVSLTDNSPINRLILRFDAQNKLTSLVSYDRQQQANLLDFSDVVLNQQVSNDDFRFSANEGWIIDDQREQPQSK